MHSIITFAAHISVVPENICELLLLSLVFKVGSLNNKEEHAYRWIEIKTNKFKNYMKQM